MHGVYFFFNKNTNFNVNLFCIPCIFPIDQYWTYHLGYAVYFYLVKIQKHILKKTGCFKK